MQINNRFNTPYRNNYYNTVEKNNQTNTPSFKGLNPDMVQRARELFEVNSTNGSLSRLMFFLVATVFMVGARFWESRSADEKREVVTRDIPAVALSCGGAPFINRAVAYGLTKATGVPIVTGGDKFSFKNTAFTSQAQLENWYSNWSESKAPLKDFSETIQRNGGKLKKVFDKLGLTTQLEAITKETSNSGILNALNSAAGSDAYKTLEEQVKNMPKDNKLLKFAKNTQTAVKLGGIAFMALFLGYFLPRLNILTTKKKYQEQAQQNVADSMDTKNSPMMRISTSPLNIHKPSAVKTFQSLLNMAEKNVFVANK